MKLNDSHPQTELSSSRYGGRRILLVDDDEDARYFECVMLSRAGYSVDTAADGEEAWNMLLRGSYDLLLSDHNMPRLCGLDLVARMRAAGMTLPIIINSGSVGLGDASNHPHLGLAAVLHKPLEFIEVLDAVKYFLLPPLGVGEEFVHDAPLETDVIPSKFVRPVPTPVQHAGLPIGFT